MSNQDLFTRGSAPYRRLMIAVFLVGIAIFLMMYNTQGLLPQIAATYGSSETDASWTVSATTLGMAIGFIPLSTVALRRGYFVKMTAFLLAATAVGLLVPFAPTLGWLIAGRFAQGFLISAVPAAALALIAHRVDPIAVVDATGIYLAGNTIGGLLSRVLPGLLTDVANWQVGLFVMSAVCLVCGVLLLFLRPKPQPGTDGPVVVPGADVRMRQAARDSLRTPGVWVWCATGALLMCCFAAAYTALGVRVQQAPFNLSAGQAGAIFLLYVIGTIATARTRVVVSRYGARRTVLGAIALLVVGFALTLSGSLLVILIGVAIITGAFFIGHTTASSSVSLLAPPHARSTASALYLTAYYVGSSIGSTGSTTLFVHDGWAAVVIGAVAALAVAAGLHLHASRKTVSVVAAQHHITAN
ncbi:MFS transporter [Branchiibius sp. NY16-3462-2]|uniref:MFS transporter n=1 Tax=Branchiibius sp. NY16-3462-2 TaxID=1807500 RepID=UPI00079B406D|nr:MFS transporter [Branchiibius sp. NY16-3462-2]KYH42929.1 hypothetical protein AZH51_01230 [Branchiibius sp. NY16-3462-2]